MRRCVTTIMCFCLLFLQNKALQAQSLGKTPEFLEGIKPNFFKMQRKAERRFKKLVVNERLEEDTTEAGQDIRFEAEYDREEDNEYHRYKRWEWFWRDRVNPDGTFPDALTTFETYQKLQGSGGQYRLEADNPTWTDVSMRKNTGGYWGLGRTQSVAINPKNPLEFYTTSNGGGVWKTTDGGKTYTAVGDRLPMLYCGKILIDHQTPTTVYVSLGEDHSTYGGGLGVYKSIDGGGTWKATSLVGTLTSTLSVRFMAMSPSDSKLLIAVTNKGLYRTANGGDTWTQIRTGSHFDVAFKPSDGNTIYASSYNNGNKSEIFKSTDAGLTWKQVSTFNVNSTIRLSTSLSAPDFLGVALMNSKQYYTSTDGGISYALRSTMPEGCELLVSQINTNNVYCGCVDNFKSNDGGETWAKFTHWNGREGLKEVHADNHGTNFDPTKPYEIYISNDGGVEKYNEQTNTWTYLSNGLAITMYYQIGVAQTNAVVMAGGTQDNGGNMRKKDGTWRNTTGGDATMCLVDPSNENIMYSQYINGGGITRTTNAWTNSTGLDAKILATGVLETDGDWATPFAIHEANPLILVAGYKDVILTSDRGDTWKKISSGLSTANIKKIAIAPSSATHIYAANGSTFHRTFDQGTTAWTSSTHPGGSITCIIVHPTAPKTIYTTNNGGNGKRVYKSIDGGVTWSNISATGLPNDISVTSIAYEKNTEEGLYIGTAVGVFYKNATMASWIYFGKGMPNAPITDVKICYPAKKVRVGTYGRGIWEADLYTLPITTKLASEATSTEKLKVFPNPFIDFVKVEGMTDIASLRLFNIAGQELEKPHYNASGTIQLGNLSKGVYTLELTDRQGHKNTAKVIKE